MVSAYELERLENIRKNNEQLQALGLAPPAKCEGASKRKRDTAAAENREPQRRSSRLQNVAAPHALAACGSSHVKEGVEWRCRMEV